MKICFKCKECKPLTEFYAHPRMADGHVNKCKSCNKIDVSSNYAAKRSYYQAYDKKRQGTKERRKSKIIYTKHHRLRYPQKTKARQAVQNAVRNGTITQQPCSICQSCEKLQAHHADYNKPLEVTWYCDKHHRIIHGKKS